jgi:hypothetical protein
MQQGMPDIPAPERRQPAGWWRWAWIGAGIAIIALFLVLFVGMLSAKRMLSWGMRRITSAVMTALPAEVTTVERERVRAELDCVVRAAEEGRADEKRLGELARACTSALEDRTLTRLELARIEGLAGAVCLAARGATPR